LDEADEYFKRWNKLLVYCSFRFYKLDEIPTKLGQLVEYYKYHKDIPRFFMKRMSKIAL